MARFSKTASTGFAGMGDPFIMKNAVIAEAKAFCGSQKKTMKTINMDATSPPFVFGNYPQADLAFASNRPAFLSLRLCPTIGLRAP